VAQEVRALAERSVREAQGAGRNVAEIQERLGRAGEIMQRLQAEVTEAAGLGGTLVDRIDTIHQAAEQVASMGEQIAAAGRDTAERSIALATAMDEGRRLADRAAEESEAVATVSAEQGAAVQQLNQAATALRSMGETLASSVARARAGSEHRGNGG
jgi:methyl-accepting chemotaxis protein